MNGWGIKQIADAQAIQTRLTFSAEGLFKEWYRNGTSQYIIGIHPFFALLKSKKNTAHVPRLVYVDCYFNLVKTKETQTKKLVTNGDIQSVKIGKYRYVTVEAVEQFLDELHQRSTPGIFHAHVDLEVL